MKEMSDLVNIRKRLHMIPELSEKEKKTSEQIFQELKKLYPTKIIQNIEGNGILCIFDFKEPGPCIIFRAELDAIPIQEKGNREYKSKHNGMSHACGHDGHMSILIGLGRYLSNYPSFIKGKIVLLFQPAEESAIGAKKIICNTHFLKLKPTHIFGFHNIPQYKLGSLLIKDDIFASSSQGLILRFHGVSSHAGHPDQGLNPLYYMMNCIDVLKRISDKFSQNNTDTFITIIHLKLGEKSFGTNPGEGVVMATFRSFDQQRMDSMAKTAIQNIKSMMESFQGTWDYDWVEVFPTLKNHSLCDEIIKHAAKKIDMEITELDEPFHWSEDFSYYLQRFPGAFFGLGAGKMHPVLHHPLYDFPDDLIDHGIKLLIKIIEETQKQYFGESL